MTCQVKLKLSLQVDDGSAPLMEPVVVSIERHSPFSIVDWKEEIKGGKADLRRVAVMLLLLDMKVLNQEPVPAALRQEE